MLRIDDKLTRAETEDFVARANKSMDEAMAAGADPATWLASAFKDADMTYGVWPDHSCEHRVGIAVLNGKGVLARARDTGVTFGARTTYVRCKSRAEAQAMCMAHGDDKRAMA